MNQYHLPQLAAYGLDPKGPVAQFASVEEAVAFGETLTALHDCDDDNHVGFKMPFDIPLSNDVTLFHGVVHYGRYGWILTTYRFTDEGGFFDLDFAPVYNDVLEPYDLANLLDHLEVVAAAGLPLCAFFKLLDALVEGTLGHPLVTEKRNNDVQRCFIDLIDKIRPGISILERIFEQRDPGLNLGKLLDHLSFSRY